LSVKYGHKFTSLFPDQPTLEATQREWANSLGNVSKANLRCGLDKCIDVYPSWPPSVGEFKKLCEIDPASIGLPSVEQAWAEISSMSIQVKYSHGVVLASRNDIRCDYYNWRLLNLAKAIPKFKPIFDEYVERAFNGEEFPMPLMIEDRTDKPVTKAEREKASDKWMEQLQAAVNK